MEGSKLQERLGNGLGDGNGLSWSSGYCQVVGAQPAAVPPEERQVLRDLARRVAELAALPCQKEKRDLWRDHNDLQETRPLIFCDPENAWYEIFPAGSLQCRSPLGRIWEFRLRKECYWAEVIRDDRVLEPVFPVHYVYTRTSRGMEMRREEPESGGAYTWQPPLTDYGLLPQLSHARVQVDFEKTRALVELAKEVFDGILEVRLEGCFWWSFGLTSDAIYLRGFENFLMDPYDDPEGLHGLMGFLRDEAMEMLDDLEALGVLTPNSLGDFVGTGGYGYTKDLPDRLKPVGPGEMWGFGESQETVSVSPAFFQEFVLPYQLPILQRFGLNIYGCCEPLDQRFSLVQTIPRLRRVTVSPWSDRWKMAEMLGKAYVYCAKINPAYMAQPSLCVPAAQREIRQVFEAAKACHCPAEVMLRDVVTLGGNPRNASDWVQLAREEACRIYGA